MFVPHLERIEDRTLPGDLLGQVGLPGLSSLFEPGAWVPSRVRHEDQPDQAALTPGPSDFLTRAAMQPTAGASLLGDGTAIAVAAVEGEGDLLWGAAGGPAAAVGTGWIYGLVTENYCIREPPFGTGTRGAVDVFVFLDYETLTVTIMEGLYVFADVPAGGHVLSIFVGGYGEVRTEVNVRSGELTEANLRLPFAAPGQLLVRYATGTPRDYIDGLNAALGVTVLQEFATLNMQLVQVPTWTFTQDYLDIYRAQPPVESVSRNELRCIGG